MSKKKNILLVEPDYPNKYPPLGLLKIGTYHLNKGDNVKLIKGTTQNGDVSYFDRIYITTLFSFYHDKTISTIMHYKRMAQGNIKKIYVGGIYASLYPNEIYNNTGIYPIVGLLDKGGMLGEDNIVIDKLIPAYELLKDVDYEYGLADSYYGYATRGCPNSCAFCAVHKLEPDFLDFIDIKKYVRDIRKKYGEKRNLILMDNNVLASKRFSRIINDIKSLGFEANAKLANKERVVDFNQGLDASRINSVSAKLLASINIKPLRLAYDYVNEHDIYEKAVRTLNKAGIIDISTYVLFNYHDSPADLYKRMRHSIELSHELDMNIYSFPMRYTPLNAKDRKYVGEKWRMKDIRGLQCILNVTKGIVGRGYDFFIKAFGDNPSEFGELLLMPDDYILNRSKHENNGANEWRKLFRSLSVSQKDRLLAAISANDQNLIKSAYVQENSKKVKRLLSHYLENG